MTTNFLLGAPKSGTTWLAGALSQHPELCVSNPKEPNVIASHRGTFTRENSEPDLQKYERFFSGEGIRIDCSAHALYCHLAPNRVRELFPEARFIVCLREPVSRAESHWNMILDTEEDRRNGSDWGNFSSAWSDERFRVCCLYGAAMERWLDEFDLDRFILIESSRMRSEPQAVCDEICSHLGIHNYEFDFSAIINANVRTKRKMTLLGSLVRRLVGIAPKWVKSPFVLWVRRRNINVYQFPLMSSTDAEGSRRIDDEGTMTVRDFVAGDLVVLNRLTGFNTSEWQ